MALAAELGILRDQVSADLISAHDYYTETEAAWRLVQDRVAAGEAITFRSKMTGTTATPAQLIIKAEGYIVSQLTEATFQQFLSIFESFWFDLLRLWLTAYPHSLGKKMVDFKAILELPDKDAITELVVGKELNEILYDRPAGWFAYLEDKVKLGCPSADEIERIAEAKASRDLLVHNRGVVNRTYGQKSGRLARFREGERIDIPEPYHRETWELLRKVVADVSDAAIAKVS